MKRIAVIGAILENPKESQHAFNDVVSSFKGVIKGRLGLPFDEANMAVISLVAIGDMDLLNAFTGKLGKLSGVTVKTAISEKTISND